MPQVDLLVSDSDRERLLEWTLHNGAVIVPDRLHSTREYRRKENNALLLAGRLSSIARCPTKQSKRCTYVGNGPTNSIDPFGNSACPPNVSAG